jgi:glycosyltransferase involved in cell wall biosynthesis
MLRRRDAPTGRNHLRIGLYFDGPLPVREYGGTERVIVWLARGLREHGHDPVVVARTGTDLPPFRTLGLPGAAIRSMARDPEFSLDPWIPDDIDVVHFHSPTAGSFSGPQLTTIHGNGTPGEFGPDHVFVSRDHMRRMWGRHFVYNGIDPADYEFRAGKNEELLFLGLASRRVKGVDRAVRIARKANRRLVIAGGRGLPFDRRVHWAGLVGNERKRELLAGASALLNPIRWLEPFGLVAVEALVSGTPVIASALGAMCELVTPEVGALCDTEESFVNAIDRIGEWDPGECRQRVLDRFTHQIMAANYLALYRRAVAGTLGD